MPDIINIEKTNEIAIAKLRANYGNPATGYCEEEADALRAKILNAPNTEEIYEIKGTKYYVSEKGDDGNDGLTSETAIKSLDAIEKLNLEKGDAILFERGSIFRFGRPLVLEPGITYGCYGQGMKPALYGSPENYAENDNWQEVRPNIWKIDFPYEFASGCTIDYGKIQGVQKWDKKLDDMCDNGDYWHDAEQKVFYLYSNQGKPSDVYQDIEIMPTINITQSRASKDLVIDNLCIKYASGFGMAFWDIKDNITITNCELGFLGGLWIGGQIGYVRFGNAIEFWAGIPDLCFENITVKNNWFYQTYDSALTWQGDQNGTVYKDITYTENLFEYNNADIEFFDRDKSVLDNFVMSDNIMRFTSMGWGSRPNDGAYRGIEGCVRAVTGNGDHGMILKSAYFTNNLLDSPARQTVNWNITPKQRENIHTCGTRLYIKSEYRTLEPCLQGLQDREDQPYDQRMAVNKQELVEMFPLFEDGADIRWDED